MVEIVDIKIKKDKIYIMSSEDKVIDAELNNTTLLNVNKINFTIDYIKSNPKTILNFLKILIKKNNVHILKIKEYNLVNIFLPIIKDIDLIDTLFVNENVKVDYEFYNLIKACKNIKELNIYNIPEFIFYTLSNQMNIKVRNETLFMSTFMNDNDIHSISDMYYKRTILINNDFNNIDINDLETFLNINKNLRIIKVNHYIYINLENIIHLLHKYNKNKVIIEIIIDENNEKVITKETKKINKLAFNNYVKVKFKYTNDYNKKHLMESVNYKLLTFIVIGLLIVFLLIIINL